MWNESTSTYFPYQQWAQAHLPSIRLSHFLCSNIGWEIGDFLTLYSKNQKEPTKYYSIWASFKTIYDSVVKLSFVIHENPFNILANQIQLIKATTMTTITREREKTRKKLITTKWMNECKYDYYPFSLNH